METNIHEFPRFILPRKKASLIHRSTPALMLNTMQLQGLLLRAIVSAQHFRETARVFAHPQRKVSSGRKAVHASSPP
jgi:hypothetical protein